MCRLCCATSDVSAVRCKRGRDSAQVPLLWTVYALVSFRQFRVLQPDSAAADAGFFQPPPCYRRKALHESSKARARAAGPPAAGAPPAGTLDAHLAELDLHDVEGDLHLF